MMTVRQIKGHSIAQFSGSESRYYQISMEWGIKIFMTPFNSQNRYDTFKTVDDLILSDTWREIQRQLKVMKYMHKIGRGPEVYDFFIVEDDEGLGFYPAIAMEHVHYEDLYRIADEKRRERMTKFFNKMDRAVQKRFSATDNTPTNLVFDKFSRKFKFIDFGVVYLGNDKIADEFKSAPQMWPSNLSKDFVPTPSPKPEVKVPEFKVNHTKFDVIHFEFTIPDFRVDTYEMFGRFKKSQEPSKAIELKKHREKKTREHFAKFMPKADSDWHGKKFKNAA